MKFKNPLAYMFTPHERRLTVATVITLVRIAMIPVIVCLIYYGRFKAAWILLACCVITDLLDGFIARRYNQQTALGAFLDPLADKLLMVSFFIMGAYDPTLSWYIPRWFIVLILVKEGVLIAGSLLLSMYKPGFSIKARMSGKVAMVFQVMYAATLAFCYYGAIVFFPINQIMVICVSISTLIALGDYVGYVTAHLNQKK